MRLATVLALCVVVLVGVSPARATDANLDPTFGTFGQVVVDVAPSGDDAAQDVLVQPDGAIVTAGFSEGNIALTRVTSTGAPDATFGVGGIVTTDVGGGSVAGIVRQSDGKLVVVGYGDADNPTGDSKFLVIRYDASGTLDAGFGTGGIVKTAISDAFEAAMQAAIQPDGKIVVVGYRHTTNGQGAIALVRYEIDGSLDAGFGTGGIVETVLPNGYSLGTDVTLQPDGKIVVSGQVSVATGNSAFVVVRYESDGSLDTGFGNNGAVITDFAFDTDIANSVAVQPDGKIVAGGHHGGRFAATRYLSDGSPDGAFGVAGRTVVDLVPGFDLAFDMVLQPDGKIVLAGYGQRGDFSANGADLAVVRLDSAGAPDGTFAPGGGVVLRVSDESTLGVGLARQADGKLVVAGWSVTLDNEVATYIVRLGGTCGDGSVDAGETCDDANTDGLDCCSVGCGLVPAGGTCEFDGELCTSDVCDGAGTCTLGGPTAICRAPTAPKKAKLAITDDVSAARDKLEFKWTRGDAEFYHFGLPTTTTSYTLCIFAGPGAAPPLVRKSEIPSGSFVATNNYKWVFEDPSGVNDGFVKGTLQARLGQPARVILKAKGTNVSPPTLPLATPVTAQLRGSNGECFGASFAAPSTNKPTRFKARGQ